MILPSAWLILAILSVIFAILALARWASEGRVYTLAVKTWIRIAVIFAIISLILNTL